MKEHDTVFGESQINNPEKWEIKKKKNKKTKLKDEKTSKVRDDFYKFYTQHKIDHPILFAYINELERDKEELMELIADINRRIKSGSFNIPMYENYYMLDVEKLLQRCKIGGQENE